MKEVANIDNNLQMLTFEQMNQIMSQTVITQNKFSKQLGFVVTELQGLRSDYSDLTERMNTLELKEECTTYQVHLLKKTAKRRIYEILGDDRLDHDKYFRRFIMRLYCDARDYAGLGDGISTTMKQDYQRCIDYMESWLPKEGIINLKNRIDKDARKREYVVRGNSQYKSDVISDVL